MNPVTKNMCNIENYTLLVCTYLFIFSKLHLDVVVLQAGVGCEDIFLTASLIPLLYLLGVSL